MDRETIAAAARSAIAGSLELEERDVTDEASIMNDLGAESIDFLDILFRIDRAINVRVRAADIRTYLVGDLRLEEYRDADGLVTERGFEQIKRALPQVDVDAVRGTLRATDVARLITVDNLATIIAHHAAARVA